MPLALFFWSLISPHQLKLPGFASVGQSCPELSLNTYVASTPYIDVKDPIHSKLLFLSPIRSRKGAYSLKTRQVPIRSRKGTYLLKTRQVVLFLANRLLFWSGYSSRKTVLTDRIIYVYILWSTEISHVPAHFIFLKHWLTSWILGVLGLVTLASETATGADGCVTAGVTLISSDFCCQ